MIHFNTFDIYNFTFFQFPIFIAKFRFFPYVFT